jgi:hypothetical protein
MNPKQIAGVTGAVGLAVIGFAGVRYQAGGNSRAKRSLDVEVELQQDYELEVDGFNEPNFVDEWLDESENSTNLWKQFNEDLGIEIDDDDVLMKQEGRRGAGKKKNRGKAVNWARLRENAVEGLHDQMVSEFAAREDKLNFFNSISGVSYGRRDPADFGGEENNEGDYAGYDKTAPIVQQFVDAFGCRADGKNLWRSGSKTSIWTLFPQSVPMFTEAKNHISDWNNYWRFVMKLSTAWPKDQNDMRFSIGTYGSSAQFTPRGYKYKANTPWSRMQKYYKKPRMAASQPRFFGTLRSTLTYLPRYGISSAAAGDNCVLIWFFQDVPSDVDDFQIPEEFEMVEELHSICTVIPIIVGPNANSDAWKNFVANVLPGTRSKYTKDDDFTGAFYSESLGGLQDDGLMEHINKYMCLVENRATCRMTADAFVAPASDGPTVVATLNFRGLEEDYEGPAADDGGDDGPAGTDAAATTGGPATTAKIPEIDSCCGHDGYSATPFDSELRTCCEDGQVRAYEFEGDDPCIASEFFK